MKAVAVKELKNRLSAYLREVRSGEIVLVTDLADADFAGVQYVAPHGEQRRSSEAPQSTQNLRP